MYLIVGYAAVHKLLVFDVVDGDGLLRGKAAVDASNHLEVGRAE